MADARPIAAGWEVKVPPPSEEGMVLTVLHVPSLTVLHVPWRGKGLKGFHWPESGLDCLIFAIFARKRQDENGRRAPDRRRVGGQGTASERKGNTFKGCKDFHLPESDLACVTCAIFARQRQYEDG